MFDILNLEECFEFIELLESDIKNLLSQESKQIAHTIELLDNAELIQKSLREISSSTCLLTANKARAQSIATRLEGCEIKLLGLQKKTGGALLPQEDPAIRWVDVDSAFQGRIRTGAIVNISHKDIENFLEDAEKLYVKNIKDTLETHTSLKVNATLLAKYSKISNDEEILKVKNFSTKNVEIFRSTDLVNIFQENVVEEIDKKIDDFQDEGSGWILQSIINLEVNINKYNPLRGNSYISLPTSVSKKRACINVKNMDDECFKWAVPSALHPMEEHTYRVSKYKPFENELVLTGIEFPMKMKQIPKFEKFNSLSINVYGIEPQEDGDFEVFPLFLTSNYQNKHINLLLLEEEEEQNNLNDGDSGIKIKTHYVWIKDLSRLVSKQCGNHKGKIFICDRCLHFFYKENKFETHTIDCRKCNNCRVRLPDAENAYMKFKNHKNKIPVPFVIYADCESLLIPVEEVAGENILKSNTQVLQKHEIFSIGFYFKCDYDDSISYYESYRGPDAANWFVKKLEEIAEEVKQIFDYVVPMEDLTPEQEYEFQNAEKCHECEIPFGDEDLRRRDHNHLNGKFRGAAHAGCNINHQDCKVIPVIFHNLSGYDAHFIIRDISNTFKGKVSLLPINKERYISFTEHVESSDIQFRFIDSYKFMASSLEELASYLTEYNIVKEEFGH